MKLEFLAQGSPNRPLIRLYEFTQDEACRLRGLCASLASGSIRSVAVEEQAFVEPLDRCRLRLTCVKSDEGVRIKTTREFECELSPLAWEQVAGLLDPFCEPESRGYQWLTTKGQASLLITRDGSW